MYECFPSTQPLPTGRHIFLLDVDGTLVISKSGRKIAGSTDWMWAHPDFPTFLATKAKDAVIALVSNQALWATSDAPAKLASILAALEAANGWRPWCLVATKKDTTYRKPARGLYDILLAKLGWREDVGVLEMCGDAVGAEDSHPAYRWADSDRQFAMNIGATFIRPCDLVLPTLSPPCPRPNPAEKEIVICVGNPGSGKSTTARTFAAAGYLHVEQDITKTAAATLKAVKASTTSVIVDATHASAKNREPYINLARERGWKIRILWHVRDGRPWNSMRPKPVPEIAYAVYSKYFEEPLGAEIVYAYSSN